MKTNIVSLLLVGLLAFASAAQAQSVSDVLAKLPSNDAAEGTPLIAQLVKLGTPATAELCKMIVSPGKGDDSKARFALHGMALHVMRSGADAERQMFETALLQGLAAAADPLAKTFIINQVQLVGKADSAAPLGKLLGDADLCEPAAQALLEIRTGAAEQFRSALPAAKGKNLVTIIHALGAMADKESAAAILPHASAEDVTLRQTAGFAMANIGDPIAIDALTKATEVKGVYARSVATANLTLLARRLVENGQKDAGLKIARDLLRTRTEPSQANVQSACLQLLADALGDAALPELLPAVDSKNSEIREATLKTLAAMPGQAVTDAMIAKSKATVGETRAAVIAALGRRGDKAALNEVLAATADPDAAVRLAGATAIARLSPKDAATALAAMMKSDDKAELEAVKAILTWVKDESWSAAVAGGLSKASVPGRVVLLELLGQRAATDQAKAVLDAVSATEPAVRTAALGAMASVAGASDIPKVVQLLVDAKTPAERQGAAGALAILCRKYPDGVSAATDALPKATGETHVALLQTLSRIGGAKAFQGVLADVNGSDEALRDAAIRALADWPDASAAQTLLALVRGEKKELHRKLALRGYLRVTGLPSTRSPADTAAMYKDAFALAKSADDKKMVLGGLAGVPNVESIKLAGEYLEDKDAAEEAAAAVVRIACPQGEKDKGLQGPAVTEVLEKLIAVCKNEALVKQAKAHLAGTDAGKSKGKGKAGKAAKAPAPAVQAAPAEPGSKPANTGNVALGKPVTTDAKTEGSRIPAKAVDGDVNLHSFWAAKGWPCWLQVDLQATFKIDTVRPVFYWDGGRYYQYTVEVSTDGEKWTRVVDNSATVKPALPEGIVHKFDAVDARYVRLNILKNSSNPSIHVVEFEVYEAGKAPASFPAAKEAATPTAAAAAVKPSGPASRPVLPPLAEPDANGFISLFNGKDLDGWVGAVNGYGVEDGTIYCNPKGGGNLYTAHEFYDFIFQFEFKVPPNGNNGVGIRAPLKGDAAYAGMEIQILDDTAPMYAKLDPGQYHGSIYRVVAAKRGALKPVNEWNYEEIKAIGSKITITLNGTVIVDADLDEVRKTADPALLKAHPGINRLKGHIGWLGHGSKVAFRNIRIKPLPPYESGPQNTPPEGFVAAFNGKNLDGWKGLHGNPESRAKMTPEQLAEAQAKADELMKAHWKVENGVLVFDGKGKALCTARDYGDFEMYADWKIGPRGDSGIYLRGSPQVQIWDNAEGSGGLYNNKINPRSPLVYADNPPGQWNRFHIKMVGERVWVWLNGDLVVDNTVMENYWKRSIPIYPTGQIELQDHSSPLWFKNIYIREIPRASTATTQPATLPAK